MAHAALHFAIGTSLGMLALAPRLKHAWRTNTPLYRAVKAWVLVSWTTGFAAIIPSLLRHAGAPESWCQGWWMNLFVLHPLINQLCPQHPILGGLAFTGTLAFQYLVILTAIHHLRHARRKGLPH